MSWMVEIPLDSLLPYESTSESSKLVKKYIKHSLIECSKTAWLPGEDKRAAIETSQLIKKCLRTKTKNKRDYQIHSAINDSVHYVENACNVMLHKVTVRVTICQVCCRTRFLIPSSSEKFSRISKTKSKQNKIEIRTFKILYGVRIIYSIICCFSSSQNSS